MKLKPGMHVRVGDAVVTFIEREGEAAHVAFQAPTVPIFREGRLSVRERQRYSRPSRRSS